MQACHPAGSGRPEDRTISPYAWLVDTGLPPIRTSNADAGAGLYGAEQTLFSREHSSERAANYARFAMGGDPTPTPRRHPAAGDIVVTKVANHYQVARVEPEGGQWASIQALDRLEDAMTLACRSITGSQRVFMYDRGDRPHRIAIDCRKPFWIP